MRGARALIEEARVGLIELALFNLDVSRAALAGHYACLDAAERARAASFRHDRDRSRFVARRGQLRARLAQEIGATARDLHIDTDEHGKPFLPDHPGLHFNLSHSRGLALCAIGHGVVVGCDIEWRNPKLVCPQVAERLFAPAERAALATLPDAQWVEGFFNCWTRKEAYVKALGLGLSHPLDAFTVSVVPGEPARLVAAIPGWSLSSFEPVQGYQAALVTGTVG